jgi:hypothetical protein
VEEVQTRVDKLKEEGKKFNMSQLWKGGLGEQSHIPITIR